MQNRIIKISVLFLSVNILSGCMFITRQERKLISPMPFEKQKWKDYDSVSNTEYRPGMARELVNKNLLVGKTRAEVFEMFGEKKDGKIIKYETKEFFWVIDPVATEFLTITFDENEKVEKAEIEFYVYNN